MTVFTKSQPFDASVNAGVSNRSMRFSIRTILFAALLVSCVLAIAVERRNHKAEIAVLRQEIDIAAAKAERLADARMLVLLVEEKETLSGRDYSQIAYTAFCMLLDAGKNVADWDFDDYTRVDTAGCLLGYLGIEKTDEFMRHAAANGNWGVGDAVWLEGTSLVEIAIESSDHVIVNTDKIWKYDQE